MLSKTEILVAALLLLATGCPAPPEEEPIEQAPAPIGDELLRFEGTWALPACSSSHMYRQGREVQYQCFDADDLFSWENRGVLSPEALDAELMAADPDDTEPVNHNGLCGTADGHGTVTMWVGERSVSFAPNCLFEGIVPLYEEVSAIHTDLTNCEGPLEKLESLEPGCRAY